MKSFSLNELAGFLGLFQKYTGAQIQDAATSNSQLLLKLRFHKNYFLLFDLAAVSPLVFLLDSDSEIKIAKKTTPSLLFVKKYFKGATLSDVRLVNGEGRVLHFYFESAQYGTLELEARLFPHGQNLIFKCSEKILSWNKPKELLPDNNEISPITNPEEVMKARWELYVPKRSQKPKKQKLSPKQKAEALLLRLHEDLKNFPNFPYKEWAEKIRISQSYDEVEWEGLDRDLPWFKNIEILLEKDQKQTAKKKALEERIKSLQQQILDDDFVQDKAVIKDLFSSTDAKGRVKILKDGRRAYVGKSAKDNLALLRNAKPWFLWMHLRDHPGAHLILQQNKSQKIERKDLDALAIFLAKESGYGKSLQDGDRFEVQYTECRYIKPIKGDKLGRVSVQREKVISVRFSH